jgi:4-phosphopantoate--beta-alanine ligase
MAKIPRSHPRYHSLITREKITDAMKKGLVHETGLIAHGRGEAFDYLIGEKTTAFADEAERVSAAALLCAEKPVISVNGNVVALVSKECVSLSKIIPARIEVNLFHRTEKRIKKLMKELEKDGAKNVLGLKGNTNIPSLDHNRSLCDHEGIFSADVVLVPLEDGDRCQALKNMGKTVIAIDLNPLSRTARSASITIVDNVIRALLGIEKWARLLKNEKKDDLRRLVESWDNKKMLGDVCGFISKKLNSLF